MPEVAGGHGPEFSRNLDIGPCCLFETAAFHQAHGGIDDGFRRQPVVGSGFESEDVAWQVKCADLTPSVRKQFVSPNGALNDLIDIICRLVLAVDFLIFSVGELASNEAGMTREQTELICDAGRQSG